ncbi:MAG: hypothetical protein WCI67_23280 [Chloroflexales bacterium]
MTLAPLTTGGPAAPPTPCPTCGHFLPIPRLPQLCPVCLGHAAHAAYEEGQRIALPRLPRATDERPVIRQVLATALRGTLPPAELQAVLRRYDGPIRFCDAACRRVFHELVGRDEHDEAHQEGRCWCCRCALPDEPMEERYFLASAAASQDYHYGTSYTALVVGTLQVVGVEADDLDEARQRFANGLHLMDTAIFTDVPRAYVDALDWLRRRSYRRPEPADPIIYLALTNGVTAQAHAIDRDGLPALEVLIQAANHLVPSWVIRTGQKHVREVDRLLRGMGVPSATMIGAKLWVELGLPLPATRS